MHIIDVNDPTNPVWVGRMDRTIFFKAQKRDNYLHLAAGNLKVLNVSNPGSPTLAANIDIMGHALDLQIVGSYAYFAGELWLSIYEFSDPIHPVWISTFEGLSGPFINSLAVANSYAYLGETMTGLHVIDLRDPAHPTRVGGEPVSGAIRDMETVGNALFVAHADGGVTVFDISDPARPVRVTGYNTSGFAQDLQVVGNYVFVADGDGGLIILESQPLQLPAMTLVRDTTNVIIHWPASALGYRLESAADLNGTPWVSLGETPWFTNTSFSLSVPIMTNQFYRLRRD